MFAVLTVVQEPRKRFGKKRQRGVECVRVAVRGGAPFLLIRAFERGGVLDWGLIERAAGRCAERLLLPDNVQIPDGYEIGEYVPSVLPMVFSLNIAVELLKSADKQARLRQKVCVIDRRALLPDYVARLVPLAAVVRVVTDFPEKYLDTARRIMESFGASIVLSTEPGNERYDAVVNEHCLPEKMHITLPDEIERLRPEGIDKFKFAAALFELCGVKSLSDIKLCEEETDDENVSDFTNTTT